jgi:ApaG protein
MNLSDDVRVSVISQYLANQSDPINNRYAFAYFVRIRNLGQHTVQLRYRYWLITNGNGDVKEVQGPGVVGEEPILAPGDEYSYTSGAVIETPFGTMQGHYEFDGPRGLRFKTEIPLFTLSQDNIIN